MNKLLKALHFIGLSLFLGSIAGHILLGRLAESQSDIAIFSSLYHAKYMNTLLLTSPGLILMLLTGVLMLIQRKLVPFKVRWILVKLLIVLAISLNGIFILTPLAGNLDQLAASATSINSIPRDFWQLKKAEDIYGAINLFLILIVIGISTSKPLFQRYKAVIKTADL